MEAGKTLKETEKELLRVLEKEYEKKGGVSAELFLEEDVNARTDLACYVFEKEKDVFTGFLSTFLPNEEEAEVTVGLFLEDEGARDRMFAGLIERAREEWIKAGIRSVHLVVDRKNDFPTKLLDNVGCATKPVFSEFLLIGGLERLAGAASAGCGESVPAAKDDRAGFKSLADSDDGAGFKCPGGSDGAPEKDIGIICKSIGGEDEKVRQYLLIKDGKELCRLSILLFLSEKAAYMYGLETAPEFRRRGAATRLIAGVAMRLLKEDWKEMTLQVSSQNMPALKLYQKLGFLVKEQRIYYRLLRPEDIGKADAAKTPDVSESDKTPAAKAAKSRVEERSPEADAADLRAADRAAKERAHERRTAKKKASEEKKAGERKEAEDKQAKEDARFMREALVQAKKAAALGEVPVGCVLVADKKIIARGYNRRNTDKTTLAHAELAAIKKASSLRSDWRLEDCTLYVTLEPCPMCAGAIVQARIKRVVAGCMNPKAGCAGSVLNILRTPGFNHMAEFTGGVLEDECAGLLQGFFQEMRKKKADTRDLAENV